jgi:site-specific DNA recombinase
MATRTRTKSRTITNGPPRAVAYVRLSKAKSKPGDTEVGLETQLAGCERAIAAMGGTVVATEQDIQSGDRLDRPGLWAAIDRVRSGEANAIIVYALDRFGRDQDQQGVAVVAIKQAGGRLLSATENLDDGPTGVFMRSVYGYAGALELEKNRERTKRALNAKFRDTGKYKPSNRPPYGYRKLGNGAEATYEVEPAEAAIVRRIYAERAAGASLRAIPAGLTRDGIPTARGGHRWGPDVVKDILDREVYATGMHRCWRTEIVREADGVPWRDERPTGDQYVVEFPPFLDPALVERARATAARNVWRSRREDRSPEVGILRYGFARCAACGRAMAVTDTTPGRARNGRPRYQCASARHVTHPCPAPSGISIDVLDGPILTWLQAIIEDPRRADAYRVERQSATPDADALAAATAAEAHVGELEQHVAGLADNLGLLMGPAAQIAAERLNAINDDLTAARAQRDRLAAACRVTTTEAIRLHPQDALAAAILEVVHAMAAADPEPAQTLTVLLRLPEGAAEYTVPLSWKAWQAALAVLNVTVTVAQEASDAPRWVAEMRLVGGVTISTGATTNLLESRRWPRTSPAHAGTPWRSSDPRAGVRPR